MGKETCEASGCTGLKVSSRFEAREQPGGPSHDYGRQWRWMGNCAVLMLLMVVTLGRALGERALASELD